MNQNRYNVMLDTMPETESRLEVLFRQAGDGFLQVEYGREQRANLLDSFRSINKFWICKERKGKAMKNGRVEWVKQWEK